MTKILDCTIRDGGYYTKWDFSPELIKDYLNAIKGLPIEYIEIGYRNKPLDTYYGEYYYLPVATIDRVLEIVRNEVKLSVMINSKSFTNASELEQILFDCVGKIELVRFASDPEKIDHALNLALKAKEMGFETAINLMYLSKTYNIESIIDRNIDRIAQLDYLYFVDSYGACFPSDIKNIIEPIKNKHGELLKLGFHGHDNVQLAFANTLTAINSGVEIIDSTVKGMGRGAGNLQTELFCTYLATQNNEIEVDFEKINDLEKAFNELHSIYEWGTSLPYMFSGFTNLPQGEVMKLMSKKRYSSNSIIQMIQNNYSHDEPIQFNAPPIDQVDFYLIIGGGDSIKNHITGLTQLIDKYNVGLIFSSLKYIDYFVETSALKYLCLPGDEIKKVNDNKNLDSINGFIVSTKFRSQINLTKNVQDKLFAIEMFDDKDPFGYEESPMQLALSYCKDQDVQSILIAGFDGYDMREESDWLLHQETQHYIDRALLIMKNKKICSILPTKYSIPVESMYSYLITDEGVCASNARQI